MGASVSVLRYLGLVGLLFACLFPQALQLMIILGMGHFALTYIYQFKAGKIDNAYIARWLLLFFLLIFGVYQTDISQGFMYLSMGYFVMHFLYDERHMYQEDTDFIGWLRISPILFLYLVFILGLLIPEMRVLHSSKVIIGGSVLLLLSYFIVFRWRGEKIYPSDLYLLLVYFGSIFLLFVAYPRMLLGFQSMYTLVVLLHVYNWYLKYFEKYADDQDSLISFVGTLVLVNAALFATFLLIKISNAGALLPVFNILFSLEGFYIWATLHFIFTFRRQDMQNWKPNFESEKAN